MATRDDIQREVDANYLAFEKILPELLRGHQGQFALIKGGKVVEYFDTMRDATTFGRAKFEDGLFSVQEVVASRVDLGWFSHAVSVV